MNSVNCLCGPNPDRRLGEAELMLKETSCVDVMLKETSCVPVMLKETSCEGVMLKETSEMRVMMMKANAVGESRDASDFEGPERTMHPLLVEMGAGRANVSAAAASKNASPYISVLFEHVNGSGFRALIESGATHS